MAVNSHKDGTVQTNVLEGATLLQPFLYPVPGFYPVKGVELRNGDCLSVI